MAGESPPPPAAGTRSPPSDRSGGWSALAADWLRKQSRHDEDFKVFGSLNITRRKKQSVALSHYYITYISFTKRQNFLQSRKLQQLLRISTFRAAHLRSTRPDVRPPRTEERCCTEEHPAAPPWGRTAPLHSDSLCPPCQTTGENKNVWIYKFTRSYCVIRSNTSSITSLSCTLSENVTSWERVKGFVERWRSSRTHVESFVKKRLEAEESWEGSDTQIKLFHIHSFILKHTNTTVTSHWSV